MDVGTDCYRFPKGPLLESRMAVTHPVLTDVACQGFQRIDADGLREAETTQLLGSKYTYRQVAVCSPSSAHISVGITPRPMSQHGFRECLRDALNGSGRWAFYLLLFAAHR